MIKLKFQVVISTICCIMVCTLMASSQSGQRTISHNKAYVSAREQVYEMREQSSSNPRAGEWECVGPNGVGRVSDLEIHPTDDKIVYCGSASGGVFKTTDAGSNWTQIFNDAKSQNIGDIALAPSDPNIVWVGTGECNAGGGSLMYYGNGVYKSTNAGQSFEHKGLDSTFFIGRISFHPTDPNIVFVAAMGSIFSPNKDRGVYRSKNGGDTWEQVLFVDDSTGCLDVRVHPTNPDRIFACMWTCIRYPFDRKYSGSASRVYRSDNGGDTWNKLGSGEGLPSSDIGKNSMDIAHSNPNVMYIIYAKENNTIKGVYKSNDGGMNWTKTSGTPSSGAFSYYFWYFCQIRINPHNPDDIITFGIYDQRSTNGGTSWSSSIFNGTHADGHDVKWSYQSQNTLYTGDDGGIWRGTSGPTGSFSLLGKKTLASGGMCIAQIYTCDVASDNDKYRYAGLQDNGVRMTSTGSETSWSTIIGGDGLYARVDQGNCNYVLGASQNGAFQRSSNRGSSMSSVSGISGRCTWAAPIEIDPTDGRVYIGSIYVNRATRGSGSFSKISDDMSNGNHSWGNYPFGALTAIGAYNKAVYAGSDDGNVFVTKDATAGSPSWTKIRSGDKGDPGPGFHREHGYDGKVRKIFVDPTVSNGSEAYVAISYYRWGIPMWKPCLYKLTNWGLGGVGSADWKDISGDLPQHVTTNKVISDNTEGITKGWLFTATDYGVFYSVNGGTNWKWFGDKTMPIITCNDLTLHAETKTLYVATYGRGLMRINLAQTVAPDKQKLAFKGTQLITNYPNPMRNKTNIRFRIKDRQKVLLAIYDLNGRMVCTLMDKEMKENTLHTVAWNRTNDRGIKVAAGNYICRVIGDKVTLAKKIIVK